MEHELPDPVEGAARLQTYLASWTEGLARQQILDKQYQTAFRAIDTALLETIAYMRDLRNDGGIDRDREDGLSALWMRASTAASPVDPTLARALRIKASGWTDPRWWNIAKEQGLNIGLEDIEKLRTDLDKKRHDAATARPVPAWVRIAGAVFALITILFLMYLVVGPPLDASKRFVFNVLMAFCASASAAFIGGEAVAQGRIPGLRGSPITFSAVGGIGTFVVIFLLLQYAAG